MVHKVRLADISQSEEFAGWEAERETLGSYYAMTHGLQILQIAGKGTVASIVEFIPYKAMKPLEYIALQDVIWALMSMRELQLDVKNNGAHQATGGTGIMSSVGWRVAMIFGEKLGMSVHNVKCFHVIYWTLIAQFV